MKFGDEYCVEMPREFDPGHATTVKLAKLFQHARPITRFNSAQNNCFIQDLTNAGFTGLLSHKIDEDRLIEIDNIFLRKPLVLRNQVSDLISFQFVSTVKRSEFLGKRKNVHDLGPAIIVSAISKEEITYRVPKTFENLRHVVVYTTLSNLMERMGEPKDAYPVWLQEILDGRYQKPRQRVFFLENFHRDLTWSCFHLPVSGNLLGHWMKAKFHELLSVGLQILRNNQLLFTHEADSDAFPYGEQIRKARIILNQEYSHPPPLSVLAQQLGFSETQLKSSFKAVNGTTVLQYCITRRIEAAKLLLNENKLSISEISGIVGYEDHSAFSRTFRRLTGCSPQQWRNSKGSQE